MSPNFISISSFYYSYSNNKAFYFISPQLAIVYIFIFMAIRKNI